MEKKNRADKPERRIKGDSLRTKKFLKLLREAEKQRVNEKAAEQPVK